MDKVEWRDVDGQLKPIIVFESGKEREATWAPQPGSQEAFLECPVFEALYEGTRGPGKTDCLLMDFAQEVGKGYGEEWKGVLFRHTYPELQDVIDKSKKWFPLIWPNAVFNEAKVFWKWPTGEKLMFRHFERPGDYWSYHGHSYPWIGWEELTTWSTDECYKSMFSCARSTRPGLPIRVRSTTNPYGAGHNWVKLRFRLPVPRNKRVGKIIRDSMSDKGDPEPERVAIHGDIHENRILLHADPGYIARIKAAARNEAELKAWLDGSWDIVAGGMFDDVWSNRHHVLPALPWSAIPPQWDIMRSYDHGSARPFSVGWWAVSNGEPVSNKGFIYGIIPGDCIRVDEWYGWSGKANEGLRMLSSDIGQGIRDREEDWGIWGRVKPGPADNSIFDDFEPGKSVAGEMMRAGVRWSRSDKSPGSRIHGWDEIRKLLKNALPQTGGAREFPGLFVTERCEQFIRTVPVLPRSGKKLDDVDTDAEDHIADEVRYFVRRKNFTVTQRDF